MIDYKEHWNNKYANTETEKLGWYEEISSPSLGIIENFNVKQDSHILIVGAGSSTLIDSLLNFNFSNITVLDISKVALNTMQKRLGSKASNVRFIEKDLIDGRPIQNLPPVDIWHDRAVLHFFTEERERQEYFRFLRSTLSESAHVCFGEFSLEEKAEKCSNLPVYKYNTQMLQDYLGLEFSLIDSFHSNYEMPSGDIRDYIYAVFKRN